MAAGRRDSSAGFTLVELLVGLALTAVAAALLTEVIGVGRISAQHSEAKAIATESVATAQELLRERIELLLADTGSGGTGSHGDTQGDTGHLDFVGSALDNQAGNGLVRYHLARGPNGVLDVASIDAREGAVPATRWRVMPLIGGVRAIEWGFYGADRLDGAPRWQAAWTGRNDPPLLVRLRLRFASGDPRTWPDLVVRPATTVSAACELDPTTGTCRVS